MRQPPVTVLQGSAVQTHPRCGVVHLLPASLQQWARGQLGHLARWPPERAPAAGAAPSAELQALAVRVDLGLGGHVMDAGAPLLLLVAGQAKPQEVLLSVRGDLGRGPCANRLVGDAAPVPAGAACKGGEDRHKRPIKDGDGHLRG